MADAGFIVSVLSLVLGIILTLFIGFVGLMFPNEVRVAFRNTKPGMYLARKLFNVQITRNIGDAPLALGDLDVTRPVNRQVRDQAAALVQALDFLVETSDNRRILLGALDSNLARNDRSMFERHIAVQYAFQLFQNARSATPPGVTADNFDELVDLVLKYLDAAPKPNLPGSVVLTAAELAELYSI
jgi:hypothetical protein